MLVLDIVREAEKAMMREIVERFKNFPVDKLKESLKLNDEEVEKIKTFVSEFSSLAISINDNNNYFLYDMKTILTVVMVCSLKGPQELFNLSELVADHMMPKGEDLKLAKEVLSKIKNPTMESIREAIESSLKKNPEDLSNDKQFINLLDPDGKPITSEEIDKIFDEIYGSGQKQN